MTLEQLELASLARPRPILKWAGGKVQLLDVLLPHVPRRYNTYIEPFLGGGALFFSLLPERAIVADSNPELINFYCVVVQDVESLIERLATMTNDEATFYAMRASDPASLSPVERAVRTIYLNRTCYNGLYRVNRKGQFNVPFGHYKNPILCDASNLRAASFALQRATILRADYKDILHQHAQPGDFVYLDPPYLPVSTYSDFKRYTKEQFYEEDHRDLALEVARLHELGCYVLLTNSNHPLAHELYSQYQIEVHRTRRNISKAASKRTGEDVIVIAPPRKRVMAVPTPIALPKQMARFPSTRYMGSKQNLLQHIWGVASQFDFESVLDLFSGSGAVSYLFKTQGKRVVSNDYMAFATTFSKALIENNATILSEQDIAHLCNPNTPSDGFVSRTFAGLYFDDADNQFIDTVRANLPRLRSTAKRSLAMAALVRACLKKRPRGIFTFVGHRYDDGRRDLTLTLNEQFLEAVRQVNAGVFDNRQRNKSFHGDAMDLHTTADLVYLDPPYFSPLSDNEYVRRYHFIEGLARDWQGITIQAHTKTKKFKSYPTPFGSRKGAHEAFDALFHRHRNSVLLVSYSSNSLPTMDEMLNLLASHKRHVEVVSVNHRYSFGNQGHKAGNVNNQVKEYVFVGY